MDNSTSPRQNRVHLIYYLSLPWPYVSSMINLDRGIGFILFLAGLYAYTTTLAPTVLDGDAALFQYTPYVLGVTYPTGYPLYILIGKLWLTIFPIGEIAWRMNLFSALCSATALPLIYGAARQLFTIPSKSQSGAEQKCKIFGARWAAVATVLTFATMPTFWRWSTEAKIYALNILLFSGILYTLSRAYRLQQEKQPPTARNQPINDRQQSGDSNWLSSSLRSKFSTVPLALPVFLLGLQLSVHSTTVLLIPGFLLFIWLHFRQHLFNKRVLGLYSLLFIIPGLLYFYIPLRAEWLIARYGRLEAISRGLLADFYHSGLSGWLRYFSAADFTGGVVTNWGLVPQQFFTVYIAELLLNNLTSLGIGLGVVGGVGLAILRPRLFWPLFLFYAVPIPFVLTYGQGEQSAFLLPSFLIFSIFIGYVVVLLNRLLARLTIPDISTSSPLLFIQRASPFVIPPLFLLFLILFLFIPQVHYNTNRLDAKWSRAIYDEWADALAHPLEPGAAVLAHWGDLTSFWYMQHAEGRRPDLHGLYPPTEEIVTDYLNSGGELYIAGPLQGWAAGIEERYQLIPWGRLIRIAPYRLDPESLLPSLSHNVEAVFDGKLRLTAVDYSPQAVVDSNYPVILIWQTLANLSPETTISLRLSQEEAIVAQLDDTLLSGWFPGDTLPAGQYVLSYIPIQIPLGTLPGKYRLQLVTYTSYKHPWPVAHGTTLLDLGEVELILPPAGSQAHAKPFQAFPGYDFKGEIELVDYEYSVSRVGQGKGFAVKLLWQAKSRPEDNYTILAEAVDAAGHVIRAVEHQPVGGRAPTSTWQTGQLVKDQVDLVLPASAPVGEEAIRVRLSWLRPDGSKLRVRYWGLPGGDSLNLDWLTVVEKEGRVYELPTVQYPIQANLDNKTRLMGYNTSQPAKFDKGQPLIEFNRAQCIIEPEACQIHFNFYWQGLREMDSLYFVFLHLIDHEGQIVAQHDQGPGKRGKQPTTSWLPDEVILDPVDLVLPSHIRPGKYTLRIGMYLPPDGPRLPILDDEGQAVGDSIEIGQVQVLP